MNQQLFHLFPKLRSCFTKKAAFAGAVIATALLFCTPSFADLSGADSHDANSASLSNDSARLDELTNDVLQSISLGDWTSTQVSAAKLVKEFPDYALGHWLLAETHNVLAMNDTLLKTLPNYTNDLVELLFEAKARTQHSLATTTQKSKSEEVFPTEMIQIGKHVDSVVLVDLHSSTLYEYDTQSDEPVLVKQHYISSGEAGFGKLQEGDLKTPLGIYQIYGYRSDESLPPLYGAGALMLNYPNTLDRALGRTGSGIWLHGNPPDDRSRSPRSSEGCVTMGNGHLTDLHNRIDINRTDVILSHAVQWQPWSSRNAQQERYQELFEQYRAAWVNSQVEDLFSLYSNDALPEHVRHAGAARTKKVSTNSDERISLSPDGIALRDLSKVDSKSISLMMNPSLNKNHGTQHLIMSFELPGPNLARVTLYWERTSASGYWQIMRESIHADGA